MRLEDLQRVLSSEELNAFGLVRVPAAPVHHPDFSDELACHFVDNPTIEFEPAA